MKNLVIGCDADGVLVNMSSFNLREGTKFFKRDAINKNAYSPKEMFNVSDFQEVLFGLKVFNKYCIDEKPIEKASIIINKLNAEGCELHEITARKFVSFRNPFGAIYRHLFEKWLKKYNMKFKSIQYCSEKNTPIEKLMACSKLSVDIMIEDKPEVALFLADNGIKVLLFDAPYNQNISHENMIRVKTWDDVYEQVSILKSKQCNTLEFKKISREEKQNLETQEKIKYIEGYKHYIKNLKINEKALENGERVFKLLYSLTSIPFSIIFKSKIDGKENIPYQNGFIIASNHLNSYDQFYISRALGNRPFYGFAASTVKNTIRGKLFDLTGLVTYIDRNDALSKENGEEELISRIVHDKIALIFPEGTRKNKTEEGKKILQLPFKLGTVSIAQKTGMCIIPVSIYYGKRKYLKIGNPQFVFAKDDLKLANKKLEDTIAKMTMESIEQDNQKRKTK